MGTTLPEADSRLKRTFSNSNRAKQLQERNTSSNGKMSAWIFLGCLLWQRLGRGTGSTPGACSGQGGRIWGHLAVRGEGFAITLLQGRNYLGSPCCKEQLLGQRESGEWKLAPFPRHNPGAQLETTSSTSQQCTEEFPQIPRLP